LVKGSPAVRIVPSEIVTSSTKNAQSFGSGVEVAVGVYVAVAVAVGVCVAVGSSVLVGGTSVAVVVGAMGVIWGVIANMVAT
jgi:membrane associated rhomboid family serine protease